MCYTYIVINMNNKGFTLIELLVTITLIATVSVTIGLSVSGILNRNNEKEWNTYIEKIEKAACTYAEIEGNNELREVEISQLLEKGYLKKNLKNPKTKENVTSYSTDKIIITWENNERICKYNPSESK